VAPSLARRATAEGLAAFALVFAGCGAIVSDAVNDGALGAVGVSLVFGLVIIAGPTIGAGAGALGYQLVRDANRSEQASG